MIGNVKRLISANRSSKEQHEQGQTSKSNRKALMWSLSLKCAAALKYMRLLSMITMLLWRLCERAHELGYCSRSRQRRWSLGVHEINI